MNDFVKYAVSHIGINSNTLTGYMSLMDSLSPAVVEERKMNAISMDVFARLMMDRIIFIGEPIDNQVANIVQAQLLYLSSVDSQSDISIYLNTPGGLVSAGLGIYDTMQMVSPEISTICTGVAASMGAVLLCAGTKKKRSALKHSRIMIHQPLGGVSGQASDILIEAKEIEKTRNELYDIVSLHSGQSFEKVFIDSDRNYWMTSEEAAQYGIIDFVI